MRNLLSRFNYPQKFGLISLLFILPLLSFLPLVQKLNADLDQYGRKELEGTLYMRPLMAMLEDVDAHEFAVEEFIDGDGDGTNDEINRIEARIDNELNSLKTVDQKYGLSLGVTTVDSQGAQTTIALNNLETQWQALKASVPTLNLHDSSIKHNLLSEAIRGFISVVGDKSSLILDPNLDTYYMMDAVLIKLPTTQSNLAEAYRQGEHAIDNSATFNASDRTQLAIVIGKLRSEVDEMEQNITVSLTNNTVENGGNAPGQMSLFVKTPLDANVRAINDFVAFIDTRILNASVISVRRSDFIDRSSKAFETNAALYDAASQALETGLRARIETGTNQLVFSLSSVAVSIALAFTIGLLLMLAISRPLRELNQAASQLAAGNLAARVAITNEDEVGQVGIAFNTMAEQLKQTLDGLEKRTVELNRRSTQLEAAALVARAAAEVRDLKELLENVVQQITERFNFYHAGIFLTDINSQFVILEAASSEGGKKMIERGHRLEIGRQGIVGFAAYQKRPRIAQDVGEDAVFFNNPDLPETHSEVALPLIVQNQLIGILDIQSQERNAFSNEDIHTLQTMADQIALAIENTRLIDESRSAIEELQILTSENTFSLWKERLSKQSRGFIYSSLGVLPLPGTKELSDTGNLERDGHAIKFPIALRGQQIGVLTLKRKASEAAWTEAEQEMASKIAAQVALAIENARLLEESQRRAEKESAISEITSKIRRTNDPNEMIRVAINELKQALNIKDVRIIPYNPPKNGDGNHEE